MSGDTGTDRYADECRLYAPGHRVHPIQARKAAAESGVAVDSVVLEGDLILLNASNKLWRCRSHSPGRVWRLAQERPAEIRLIMRWGVLRVGLGSVRELLCLAQAQEPWTDCR